MVTLQERPRNVLLAATKNLTKLIVQWVTLTKVGFSAMEELLITYWYQSGIVWRETVVTRFQRNVYPWDAAVLTLQAGLMVNIHVCKKEWYLVKSVITGQVDVVNGKIALKSETAATSMCTSFESLRRVHYAIVGTKKVRIFFLLA